VVDRRFPVESMMNDMTFDTLTRRTSLLSLGTAGIVALALPVAADAKNKRKKKGKKKAKQKCQSQVAPCATLVGDLNCGFIADPAEQAACLARVAGCCERVATCDFTGFIACLDASQP